MPYRAYSPDEKAHALEVIAQHDGDIQAARADLLQRWDHAPSLSTLIVWQGQNGPDKGNAHHCQGARHTKALNSFEDSHSTPWQKLMEAVAGLGDDPECTVIIIGRGRL